MNARYVCNLLTNYANANPLDADRALFARAKVIKENRGFMDITAFDLFGQTADEFVQDLIDTMNSADDTAPEDEE